MTGQTVSHYRIIEKLGEGGMGVVWKAEDIKLRRIVALKFLPPAATSDPEFRARFLQEAQAAASLSHPNVCTVFDVDEEAGFLAMEFIEGETVQALVSRRPLRLPDAIDLAMQAALGLQAAHERGVVHRDIKTGNLMVTPQGALKIMDFGLARLAGGSRITRDGVVAGTPGYMSPEQAQGKPVDRRSDLWSLGVALYEMVVGRAPFRGESDAAVIHGILHADPEPVTAMRTGLPLELDRVIAKALEKDPQLRYQSAADMGADLRRLKRDSDPKAPIIAAHVSASAHRRRSIPWKPAAAVGAVVLLAVACFALWQRLHRTPLNDKDVLVLADFTNNTGEAVFDTTLRQALAVQLEQSPFLKILSDEGMRQDLGFMGRPPDERITNRVAREICQREGHAAMIGGAIAGMGKTYAIALEASNCQTGEALARENVEAEDKDHVLRALSTAATRMRAKLGESLASIQKLSTPTQQVTTTSLEAFQSYAFGRDKGYQGQSLAAIPFFQHATELDPNFASAFERLGTMYCNSSELARCAQYIKKAFALTDRVSERERLTISARYYYTVTGEFEKAIDAYQVLARTYPRDASARNSLGLVYRAEGDWEKALVEFREAMRLDPRLAFPYSNQVIVYANIERFDEAKAVAAKAFGQQIDSSALRQALLRVAILQGDRKEAERHIQWLSGKPEEYSGLNPQAADAAALGRFQKAAELLQKGAQLARARNLPDAAAHFEAEAALNQAALGSCEAARSQARAAILLNLAPADIRLAAMALALCGDSAAAQKAADDTSRNFPHSTLWNAADRPVIEAAIELNRNQPAKAVEALQSAVPYEPIQVNATYMRGQAYLRARKGTDAAAEFQKVLGRRGVSYGAIYALSYVGLARSAALAGDTERARKAYQDLLALWKDADPDIPVLKEVRQEYGKLK